MIKHSLVLEYRVHKLEQKLFERATGELPKYFYHGTSAKAADKILKTGLSSAAERKAGVVHRNLTNPYCVYLCASEDQAKEWGSMADKLNYVVLQIDSKYIDPEKLSGDFNVIKDDLYGDEDNATIDELLDVEFENGKSDTYDFEYRGSVPPEAITVVWRSDPDTINLIDTAVKNKDVKQFIKNWDDWKDIEYYNSSVARFFSNMIRGLWGVPDTWDNKKMGEVLSRIPVKVLNSEIEDFYGNKGAETVFSHAVSDRNIKSSAQDILEFLQDVPGISDKNIAIVWKNYSKADQSKNIDRIKSLPDRFLNIGKPYIAKKLYKTLGI